ncbi:MULTISPECIES: hypothetical protein [unclassified Helicobacter]|nr:MULTISPECIES: hypothetical protein [unclassified Helicobacter]
MGILRSESKEILKDYVIASASEAIHYFNFRILQDFCNDLDSTRF